MKVDNSVDVRGYLLHIDVGTSLQFQVYTVKKPVQNLCLQGVMAALGNSLSYTFSLCLPSLCPAGLLDQALSTIAHDLDKLDKNITITFQVPDSSCHTRNQPSWTSGEILGL